MTDVLLPQTAVHAEQYSAMEQVTIRLQALPDVYIAQALLLHVCDGLAKLNLMHQALCFTSCSGNTVMRLCLYRTCSRDCGQAGEQSKQVVQMMQAMQATMHCTSKIAQS